MHDLNGIDRHFVAKVPRTDSNASERRVKPFELLNVTGLCLGNSIKRLEPSARRLAIHGANVSAGLPRPRDGA